MRFRWDWLQSVVSVPYVPTLGPVAPEVLSSELFNAVYGVAQTRRFLPYDKDQRWSDTKDEQVIVEEITHRPLRTVIPTLTTRGRRLVKIYHYGPAPDLEEMIAYGRKLCATYGAAQYRLLWFGGDGNGARTRVMLKTFGANDDQDGRGPVMPLDSCPYSFTFRTFTAQLASDGFAFLYQHMVAGHVDGPVLVAVDNDRVVGAIGPLATLKDAHRVLMQPPQYFAVHPAYRGRGHGRALWRAAMAWGRANGAAYKVLEATCGGLAERLYLSEELVTMGFTYRISG